MYNREQSVFINHKDNNCARVISSFCFKGSSSSEKNLKINKSLKNKILVLTLFFICLFNVIYAQTTKDIEIQGYGGKLKAVIYKPYFKNGNKIPFVIICHGFAANKEMPLLTTIAHKLQKNGIGSILFDYIGHGESYGKQVEMTVPKQIIDTKRVYEFVSRLPYVGKIAMVGHSQAGVITAMVGAELGSDKIPAIILLAPAGVLRDDVLRGNFLNVATFTPDNPPETLNVVNVYTVGKEYLNSLKELPIYETSRNYDGQTLIIHGKSDVIVPYTYGKRFYDEIRHSHFKLLDGQDHNFTGSEEKIADLCTEFLKNELK